jgi:hypothetical protein
MQETRGSISSDARAHTAIVYWINAIPHFIRAWVDEHSSYFYFWLLGIWLLWTRVYTFYVENMFALVLRRCTQKDIVTLEQINIFEELTDFFSIVAAPFCILTHSVWRCQFLPILAILVNACYFLSYYSHPAGYEVVAQCILFFKINVLKYSLLTFKLEA